MVKTIQMHINYTNGHSKLHNEATHQATLSGQIDKISKRHPKRYILNYTSIILQSKLTLSIPIIA